MSLLDAFLTALLVCVLLQGLLWLVALRIRNWSLVDPGWAACVLLAGVLAALLLEGNPTRRLAVGLLASLWGVRHVVLLLRHRVLGHPEEGRYVALRARWGPLAFLAFFQAQALLAAGLAWPFLLACADPAALGPHDAVALALFAAGLAGEALADRQLRLWKADPARRGRTCRAGLWSWSRHPNYFFEVVMWVAFALLASGAPGGAFAWTAPATLLLLILFVTGIPPSERQALLSRGEDYRAYQREVSAFVPWPPRRATGAR